MKKLIPDNWIKAIPKKDDRAYYDNSRGISIMHISEEILAFLLLNKL